MENPIRENCYEEEKQKAQKFYASIGKIWCPALNEYVLFDRSGFRHLIWKNTVPRPRNEQKRRFALLPQSVKILENQNAHIVHRKENNLNFWAFTEKHTDKTIKVIVRQIDGREKHFFSVF